MAFNQLTDAEAERLAMLAEECGEVVKAVGKVLRHGFESVNPDQKAALTNRQKLTEECGDVVSCILKMVNLTDLDHEHLEARIAYKNASDCYTHHQE